MEVPSGGPNRSATPSARKARRVASADEALLLGRQAVRQLNKFFVVSKNGWPTTR
jgi:hypothetical protein